MASSKRFGISIFLIGVVLAAGCWSWLITRKLIPLDVPISLAPGHFHSPDFKLNLNSGYFIEIEVTKAPFLKQLDCWMWGCYGTPTIIKAHWALSHSGHLELTGASDDTNGASGNLGVVGRKIGYFRGSDGVYDLEIDTLSDASILNAGNPRLKVEADGEGYKRLERLYIELLIIPALLIIVGGTLILRSAQ
jgi:hypothetical protein